MASGVLSPSQATVGTSASKIVSAGSLGKSVRVRNTHATNTVFIGKDNTVTTSNGYPVPPGQSEILYGFVGDIWAIGSGAGTTVGVLGLS